MLEYQRPSTELTLGNGLSEYYSSHDGLVGGRGASPGAREFFRCHDAAHVVFGCDISLRDEAIVKIWSLFGTTAGLSLLRDYRSPESKEVYEQLGGRDIAATAIASVGLFPLVLWRCSRMRRRWPWLDFDRYRGVPLSGIRAKYGIRLVSGGERT